jgi:hypothetical protein
MLVPSTTRWALSNGMVRFSLAPTISPKSRKYCYFPMKIPVKPSQIHVGTLFQTSMLVPSTTRRALCYSMVRFSITRTVSPKSRKYWYFTMKIPVKPSQIYLGTLFQTCQAGTGYNSTSSIHWYENIFHNPHHIPRKPKILIFYHKNLSIFGFRGIWFGLWKI